MAKVSRTVVNFEQRLEPIRADGMFMEAVDSGECGSPDNKKLLQMSAEETRDCEYEGYKISPESDVWQGWSRSPRFGMTRRNEKRLGTR